MARLTSIARGGYYPFDPEHIPAVTSMFRSATKDGFLLDPCAGEGEALELLAKTLGLKPYANELDHERAAACRERFGITQSAQGDLMTLRTSHNAYVLQWVNPPYSQNKAGRRALDMFIPHTN